jgi:two-component sensor histidine kinase
MNKIYPFVALFLIHFSPAFAQKTSLDILLKLPDDTLKVDTISRYGVSIEFEKMSESLRSQQIALQIAQKLGDKKRIGIVTYRMGCEEQLLGKLPESFNHLLQAYSIFEELKMGKKMVQANQKIAQVLVDKNDVASAMKYYQKTIELAQKFKYEEYVGHALSDMATIQSQHKKDYDLALKNFQKATKIYEKLGQEDFKQSSLINVAGTYKKLNQYEKALEILNQSVTFYHAKKDVYAEATANALIGEVLLEKKQYLLAEQKVKEALALIKQQEGNLPQRVEFTDLLRKIYDASQNIPAAYEAQKAWRVLYDTLSNQKSRDAVAELQTRFETAQKETQIKDLDQETKTQKSQLIFAIIGMCVLASLLGLGYLLYKKLQVKNQKIEQQSQQLNTLMKELHHRVKNNLAIVSSLLNIQSNRLEDKNAAQAVREGQMRVQAMSMIHQRLYNTDNVSSLNIKLYLTELAESLMRAYGYDTDSFDLKIEAENPDLDVDMAIPIGLIVNELITNSFKYAYEGIERPSLIINFKNTKNITLTVQDNGIGIDEKEMNRNTGSFGKKMVKGLTKQINGNCKFENNRGTYFELIIPKAA